MEIEMDSPRRNYFWGPMQSKVLIVLYAILYVMYIITAIVKRQFNIGLLVSLLIGSVFIVYNTSCLVLGGCNIWAWISTVGVVLSLVGLIVFLAMTVAQKPVMVEMEDMEQLEEE
jgi:hypothetical protein